jgi:chemotaxis protein CheY-P-specific phosphatase CheC
MLNPLFASDSGKLAELMTARDAAQQKLDDLYSSWLSEADNS